jgi:hypothetical protein
MSHSGGNVKSGVFGVRGVRRIAVLLGFAALHAVPGALAHDSGHGPELSGRGPRGGRLAAIVPAADAELGPRARVAGSAEWLRKGSQLAVHLRTASGEELPLDAAAEVKWIVMGRAVPKPEVIRTAAEGGARLMQVFEPSLLDRADLVEVILPAAQGKPDAGKQVFVLKLK